MSMRTRKGFVRTMVATFIEVEMNSPGSAGRSAT
jgi:hypothetical protein